MKQSSVIYYDLLNQWLCQRLKADEIAHENGDKITNNEFDNLFLKDENMQILFNL